MSNYPGNRGRGRGRGQPQPQYAQQPVQYVQQPPPQQVQYVQQPQYGQPPPQQQVVYAQQPQYGQPPPQNGQPPQQRVVYAQQPQYGQPPPQQVQYGQPPPQQVQYGQPPPQQQYGQPPPQQVQYGQPPPQQQPQYAQQPQYQQPPQQQVYAQPMVQKNSGPPPPSYGTHQKKNIYQMADDQKNNKPSGGGGGGGYGAWQQPRPDAKGTCPIHPNYSESQAREDAKVLRKAMKGMGCNKNEIVNLTGSRNGLQRAMIKKAFVTVDSDKSNKNRDLIRDLKSELGGSLQKLVTSCYFEVGENDARLVLNALAGMGFNSELLIEVVCTRTNQQIKDMKVAWKSALRRTKSMDDEVRMETKKMMSGNHFQSLILKLLEGGRPRNTKPNPQEVHRIAEELNRKVQQSKKSDCKSAFIDVYTNKSWAFIAALSVEFQNVSKKFTLDAAIKKAFGDGSDTAKTLRCITAFCAQPYDFWAERLKKSMKGLGTNDDLLIRCVVSRCEIDMFQVRNVFGQRYGGGKTLKNWIEDDTSGAYRRILSLLCGY